MGFFNKLKKITTNLFSGFTEADEAFFEELEETLSILSSLLFVLWGVFGTKAFIRQFSQDEAIVAYGTTYLKICQIFAAGIFLGTFTQRLLQSPPAGPSPVCWRRWRALWPSL